MAENKVVDLCDSSDDEAEKKAVARSGSKTNPLDISHDSSDDEPTNKTIPAASVPTKQEIIDIVDSSDDDDDDTPVVVESVARMPPANAEKFSDDSDSDSSDDERDRLWHLQPVRRVAMDVRQSIAGAESTAAAKEEGVEPEKGRELPPVKQSSESSVARGQSLNASSITQPPRWKGKQVQHVAVSRSTPRSPAKKAFRGRPKNTSPARRHSLGMLGNQGDDGLFSSHRQGLKQSSDSGTTANGRAPTTKIASECKLKSGTSTGRHAAPSLRRQESESSSDSSLMASGPVFAKRPMNGNDAARHEKTTSIARKQPIGKGTKSGDGTLMPCNHAAVNNLKPSPILPLNSDSRVAKQRLNAAALNSRNLLFNGTRGLQSGEAARDKSRAEKLVSGAASRVLKRDDQPRPEAGDLVALGRKNKGRKSSPMKHRIRKVAATERTSSFQSSSLGMSRNGKESAPALKRTSPPMRKSTTMQRDKNRGDIAGPSKKVGPHASDTRHVDGTISPTTLDERAVNRSGSSSGETSHCSARKSDTGHISCTPFPRKDVSSQTSSGCGSVVSPAEDSCDDRILVTSRNLRESSDSVRSSYSKDEIPNVSSLAEKADILPSSPKHSDANDSPMADSQASSEFEMSYDSGSETAGEGMVAENANLLHGGLTVDEGMNIGTRKTKKVVNYKDAGDEVEFSDSSVTPPRKRQKGKTSVSNDADYTGDVAGSEGQGASETVRRSSKRKRNSVVCQESLPELEDEEDDELPPCLSLLEHTSKYTYDENGLPTHEFSVLADDGKMLLWLSFFVKSLGI